MTPLQLLQRAKRGQALKAALQLLQLLTGLGSEPDSPPRGPSPRW